MITYYDREYEPFFGIHWRVNGKSYIWAYWVSTHGYEKAKFLATWKGHVVRRLYYKGRNWKGEQ